MSTTAVNTRLDVVNEDAFIGLATEYSGVKALVNALAKSEDPERDLRQAFQVIADLEHVADNGQSYTPAERLGFGSNNASTVAAGILGRGMSPSKMRSQFAKVGKA